MIHDWICQARDMLLKDKKFSDDLIRYFPSMRDGPRWKPKKKIWGDKQTHRQQGDIIILLSFFFQNEESKLKVIKFNLSVK
jgi:hypothetical protein